MVHVILKKLNEKQEQILSEYLKKKNADGMMAESQMQQHDHDHSPSWTLI